MIQRIALLVFLAGCPVVLSGCALVKAPLGMVNRLFSAGGRAFGMGADNSLPRPLRLETGEIERARGGEALESVPVKPETVGQVAVR